MEVIPSFTSHYNAPNPKVTIAAPDVTIVTADDVEGRIVVVGRGVA